MLKTLARLKVEVLNMIISLYPRGAMRGSVG
jgi:hypothetical protein